LVIVGLARFRGHDNTEAWARYRAWKGLTDEAEQIIL
jgi:hypothetical protein